MCTLYAHRLLAARHIVETNAVRIRLQSREFADGPRTFLVTRVILKAVLYRAVS